MHYLRWVVYRLQDVSYLLARVAAVVAGVLLLYMVGHIMLDIVLRVFFATSTYVVTEFVGYAVAAMTFLALAYALEEGALIRVNIVLYKLGPRARRVLEIFCAVATLWLTLFIAQWMWFTVSRHITRGTTSPGVVDVPMWIPTGAVFLGIALLALQLGVRLLRLLIGGPVDIYADAGNDAGDEDRGPEPWRS